MSSWIQRLHRFEDALLVILLSAMILLAGTQILLRNLLDTGFVWIDPLLRVLVLWLGLLGATVATRHNKHIKIDVLTRFFSRNRLRLIQAIVGQISACTCLVVAVYGFQWVRYDYADAGEPTLRAVVDDYADGLVAFAGIPAWMLEAVIPFSFALIGLRYLYLSWFWARLYLRHLRVTTRARK